MWQVEQESGREEPDCKKSNTVIKWGTIDVEMREKLINSNFLG